MKITQKLIVGFVRLKLRILAAFSKKKAAEVAFRLFCTPFAKPPKTTPKILEKAVTESFSLNGLKITGYRWNAPQKNKVLIIHGFSSAAYKFSNYIETFIDKGFEVLAFDAPAHGRSEGKTVTAVTYSEMVKKTIELYGPIQGFIAHSFGAIALSLAVENLPPLDADTKIVFIAPATETSTAIDTASSIVGLKDEAVRKEIDRIIFTLSGKETGWFSMRRIMHKLHTKILWIQDEDDTVTPINDALKVKADNHSNIEFIITKGLGHRRIYHDDAVKKQVTDFISA